MGKSKSNLGDSRLDKVFDQLLSSMLISQSVILRQLGRNRNEEVQFGRFVNNDKVTPDSLLSCYWENKSLELDNSHVLVISDTSTISYEQNARRNSLVFTSRHKTKEGYHVHPSLMMNAQTGSCYGIAGVDFHRTDLQSQKLDKATRTEQRRERLKKPLEEKQSYKWLSSPSKAIANFPHAAHYTLVGDRDTDNYELMCKVINRSWDFVYRSKTNRSIADEQGLFKTLRPKLDAAPAQHSYKVELRATKKRSAHEATLQVKYLKVILNKPSSNKNQQLPDQLPIWVVEVQEDPSSVQAGEKPIHWILLTSHPVQSTEQAMQIIQWYIWRWTIEEVFRALKLKGINLESAQLTNYHALTNITTLALIVAVQALVLVKARDGTTQQPIQSAFSDEEVQAIHKMNQHLQGRTVKQQNPHHKHQMAFAAWVIARLGGWKGYQSQRPPGPITMMIGLNNFYLNLRGFYILSG